MLKNKALTQNGDHSWDSESEREEEPASHSRQELTEMASEKTIRREPKEHNTNSIKVALDNEQKALETFCVPVDDKRLVLCLDQGTSIFGKFCCAFVECCYCSYCHCMFGFHGKIFKTIIIPQKF